MLQNPYFPGLHPGPRWESLQRSLRPLTYGEGLIAPHQEPHPALGPSGLVSMGFKLVSRGRFAAGGEWRGGEERTRRRGRGEGKGKGIGKGKREKSGEGGTVPWSVGNRRPWWFSRFM